MNIMGIIAVIVPVLLQEFVAGQHSSPMPKGNSGLIIAVHDLITSPLVF
jgi:hypothetical protein